MPATAVPTVASLNLKEVKFNDVVITEETSYPIAKNNKHVTTTIQSIFLIPIVGYTTIQLRSVAIFLGIKCDRTSKKPDVCQNIVEWVSDESNAIITVTETESESSNVSCVINCRRYFNVIYSDVIRPIIATKGMSLTKDQLTEGLKQDQTLHTLIANEYNNIKPEY